MNDRIIKVKIRGIKHTHAHQNIILIKKKKGVKTDKNMWDKVWITVFLVNLFTCAAPLFRM